MMEQTFDDACPGLCAITNALRHQVAGYTFSLANFLLCTSVSLVNQYSVKEFICQKWRSIGKVEAREACRKQTIDDSESIIIP